MDRRQFLSLSAGAVLIPTWVAKPEPPRRWLRILSANIQPELAFWGETCIWRQAGNIYFSTHDIACGGVYGEDAWDLPLGVVALVGHLICSTQLVFLAPPDVEVQLDKCVTDTMSVKVFSPGDKASTEGLHD